MSSLTSKRDEGNFDDELNSFHLPPTHVIYSYSDTTGLKQHKVNKLKFLATPSAEKYLSVLITRLFTAFMCFLECSRVSI